MYCGQSPVCSHPCRISATTARLQTGRAPPIPNPCGIEALRDRLELVTRIPDGPPSAREVSHENDVARYGHRGGRPCRKNPALTATGKPSVAICGIDPVPAWGMQSALLADAWISERFQVRLCGGPGTQDAAPTPTTLLIVESSKMALAGAEARVRCPCVNAATSIIGYCNDVSPAQAQMLLNLGFRAVIPNSISVREFVGVICAVALGGTYLHAACRSLERADTPAIGNDPAAPLSERELDVLRHVALGNSLKEIAAHLRISTKTVDTYKMRASRKLNLRNRVDIVHFAIRSGWM